MPPPGPGTPASLTRENTLKSSRNSLEVRDQSPPLNLNIDMMEDSDSANNEDSGFTSIKVGGDRMLIANNIALLSSLPSR